MTDEVIARIDVAPGRRWLGVGMIGLLAALLVYLAMSIPFHLPRQLGLLAAGGLAFWLAMAMHRSTSVSIELTGTQLRDGSGMVLAEIADIVAVERGVLAFKPSNGFLVRTASKQARAWKPGLWWRLGRRVGVGGVLSAGQTKAMADTLAAMIVNR
ncbi:hypothetical protein [Chachezhania antarctica]|uniref:hypothetical protein n=1 Tax=Chachezhania antarctica TaxID=2340860 RepID=UPI000EACAB63|nr:hypothetical protein [Chachezhania antarctica]|tara:strand:- start:24 stop:491 length:468 start_codon:yes stop_codon:yes gene_type:complete